MIIIWILIVLQKKQIQILKCQIIPLIFFRNIHKNHNIDPRFQGTLPQVQRPLRRRGEGVHGAAERERQSQERDAADSGENDSQKSSNAELEKPNLTDSIYT
jgi:hypothetical protein